MPSSDIDYDKLGQSLRRVEHDSVGIPRQELEKKNGLVKQLINDTLLKDVQLKTCVKDIFYAGSAYERLQAGEANDFDIQLFVKLSETKASDWKIVSHENMGAWKILKYIGPAKPNVSNYLENGCLSAVKLRQKFESLIDRVLANQTCNGIQVRRSTKGPAITLTVKAPRVKEFTIDLVIAIQGRDVGRNDRDFVAKPFDKKDPFSNEYIWRSSFSQIEKDTFDGLDRGNLVHKKVLRILKLAFRQNAQMAMFPNYVLKNVMFAALERYSDQDQWRDNQLPYRFYDVLKLYRDMLNQGNVPVYFEKEIPTNLLQNYSRDSVQQVVNHLDQRVLSRGTDGIIGLIAPLIAAEPKYNRPSQVPRTIGG